MLKEKCSLMSDCPIPETVRACTASIRFKLQCRISQFFYFCEKIYSYANNNLSQMKTIGLSSNVTVTGQHIM